MKNKNILISGMGIAGLSAAYWLKKGGYSPTLVEKATSMRKGVYKIDIRGAALEVIKQMGLYDAIKASSTDMRGATIVDSAGNTITEMSGDTFGLAVREDLEILRGDLCQILVKELEGVELLFGDSIQNLEQHPDHVQVTFQKGASRRFDLVIGADGLHSRVRTLSFGPEWEKMFIVRKASMNAFMLDH